MIETRTLVFRTKSGTDVVDITKEVSEAVKKSKINSGVASVFVTGSTASVSTMEYEPNLINDVKRALERIAPEGEAYEHHKTWGDDNGSAHVRATLMKPGITIPFREKKLLLGTWQQIVLLDFDTRAREREIVLQIMGD